MIQEIPLNKDDGNQEFNITLDNELFKLGFIYNTRMLRWFMNIYDSQGISIVLGIGLLRGVNLLEQYRYKSVPKGGLYVIGEEEMTEDNFGDTVKLYYETV